MHEFAVEPECREGIEEAAMRRPAFAGWADAQPLIEPGQRVLRASERKRDLRQGSLAGRDRMLASAWNIVIDFGARESSMDLGSVRESSLGDEISLAITHAYR
jgi:hypothetical protein